MQIGHGSGKHICLTLIGIVLFTFPGFATHQRAAEIMYRHLSGNNYEITLISYTFTKSAANAFRDVLLLNFGDGTTGNIQRVDSFAVAPDITYNKYLGTHSFPGPGLFRITCEDPNRNNGILNIPNSVNIPLFIYSELYINPFLGAYNNSPVLLVPPIDNGCVNQPFYHNPGAYDIDGDSLSYRLVPCLGAQGLVIPGYSFPPASDSLTINPITGDLIWDSPMQQGEFNVAILIEEWRNGQKIGSVLRDMQINVVACNNRPPVIEVIDTCIEAGKTLNMVIRAFDPDSSQVTLTGVGGPLLLADHPATLIPPDSTGTGHTQVTLHWETICNHVKRQPYSMFFKATDNGTPVHLVTIKTANIKVIGPAPRNLTATALGTSITLAWDNYTCLNATGYYIFRKTDSTGFLPGYCQTGVPAYLGYSLIDQVNNINQNAYIDNEKGQGLVQGIRYCYMIVAVYPDKAESYASNEVCAYLKKDVAVITNVSVNATSQTNGSIYIAWSKPTEIDTILAPGPYKYLLYRIATTGISLVDSMPDLNDTTFTDTLLNTFQNIYIYRVDLYNVTPGNRFRIGPSHEASSIFLRIIPTDKRLKLSWNEDVPWTNFEFTIYRKNTSGGFDSVGSSTVPSFTDKGLVNGKEYCYFVKTIGGYAAPGFIDPIINFSQINCGIPVDNVPPCPLVLKVVPDCPKTENVLTWKTSSSDSCDASISRILVYFSHGNDTTNMSLIDSILSVSDTMYIHHPGNSIAGCYALVAVDSLGNRSLSSNRVCINLSDCADFLYHLPDFFSPNGDTHNELFTPFPYTSVDHIQLTILNRWGTVVFETNNPDINWDGKNKDTGQAVSDGVYFYVCEVFEITLEGIVPRVLKGTVTILR